KRSGQEIGTASGFTSQVHRCWKDTAAQRRYYRKNKNASVDRRRYRARPQTTAQDQERQKNEVSKEAVSNRHSAISQSETEETQMNHSRGRLCYTTKRAAPGVTSTERALTTSPVRSRQDMAITKANRSIKKKQSAHSIQQSVKPKTKKKLTQNRSASLALPRARRTKAAARRGGPRTKSITKLPTHQHRGPYTHRFRVVGWKLQNRAAYLSGCPEPVAPIFPRPKAGL